MVNVMQQVKIRRNNSPSDKDKSKQKSTEGEKQEKSFDQKNEM